MQDHSQPADVFVGVDIAKGKHYASAVTARGEALFARPVPNDEAAIRRLVDDAAAHGSPALVVDTTSSAAVLTLTVAAELGIPVTYVTGLVMRRAADLYAGAAKTDPKDAQVLADYAWRNADRLTWTSITDDLLARLRILNGRDTDLAADATRAANRLRDALLAVSPALKMCRRRQTDVPGRSQDGACEMVHTFGVAHRWQSPRSWCDSETLPTLSPDNSRRDLGCAQSVTVAAEATWSDTIGDLATDLDRIIARRDQLAADIEAAFLEHPLGKVLNTMCGFGPRTGARTLAEIGDPNRFDNPGRLAAYAGLAPSTGNQAATRPGTWLHVQLADEAWNIGEAPASESYLNPRRILEVAKEAGAETIHPRYGVLTENASFARQVSGSGITWVDPRHPPLS